MQNLLFWFFAVYIAIECFVSFYKMDSGDKFCRVAKYSLACAVGMLGVIFNTVSLSNPICLIWIVPNLAVALFLWPTTYARFTGGFKNRIGDV